MLTNDLTVGIVCSRFNEQIIKQILKACTSKLKVLGVRDEAVIYETVPGALEIPIALQNLINKDKPDVLIAIGAVVRGDTYHFEVVSEQSASGIMRVQLDNSIPIINAVLTTNTAEQALQRVIVKGEEAAEAAIEMAKKFAVN
jgi:6,7-dimethyl-8-ribityllumazine synthase|tara:strand:- start:624 stop:1052 length:429 start_codon:yes stop_codon:yes gene_type:complete